MLLPISFTSFYKICGGVIDNSSTTNVQWYNMSINKLSLSSIHVGSVPYHTAPQEYICIGV